MTPEEIHSSLKDKFGEAVGDLNTSVATPFFEIFPGHWTEIATALRDEPQFRFDCLKNLCGVDYPKEEKMAVVYHLFSYEHRHECAVKVFTKRDNPSVPTMAKLWPTADWQEREAFDLLGIDFPGHPALRRILLPDDWEGHPLRKDYVIPESYHGIPNIAE